MQRVGEPRDRAPFFRVLRGVLGLKVSKISPLAQVAWPKACQPALARPVPWPKSYQDGPNPTGSSLQDPGGGMTGQGDTSLRDAGPGRYRRDRPEGRALHRWSRSVGLLLRGVVLSYRMVRYYSIM